MAAINGCPYRTSTEGCIGNSRCGVTCARVYDGGTEVVIDTSYKEEPPPVKLNRKERRTQIAKQRKRK